MANLWLLTAGHNPPNPAETLSSARFEHLLSVARSEFDFILIDTPPLLAVSDPCIVSPRTDGLLLVVRTNKNTRAVVRQTNHIIAQHGIHLLGVVANGLNPQADRRYGYTYGYNDYLEPSDAEPRPATTPASVGSKPMRSRT